MRGTWQTTDGGGRGGLVLAVIAAAALLGSGAASAIASAVVTILIIVAVVIVLAVAAGRRLARPPGAPGVEWPARPDINARPVHQLAAEVRPHLEASGRPAIGPGREVHLHLNVTPDQLAAIVRHHTEEDR